jgi:hypothetical protein
MTGPGMIGPGMGMMQPGMMKGPGINEPYLYFLSSLFFLFYLIFIHQLI